MSAGEATTDLLAAAVAGDTLALERLLLEHYQRLERHVAPLIPTRLQSLIDADDVLQQTFVQAFRDISEFRPSSQASFHRWLATIAERRLLDAIKAQKRKKRGGAAVRVHQAAAGQANSGVANLLDVIAAKGPAPSQVAARGEALQALQVALAGLPDDYREVIQLRYLEGHGEDEVAQRMGRPPDAVRGLCHRAKKKLRDAMGRSSFYFSRKG